MNQVIGLTGRNDEMMAIVAAQLLQRLHARNLRMCICLGVTRMAEATVIQDGEGELWHIGADAPMPDLVGYVDRVVDCTCDPMTLIERVDHALGQFLSGKAPWWSAQQQRDEARIAELVAGLPERKAAP